MEPADVNGSTEHDGSSAIDHAEQTDLAVVDGSIVLYESLSINQMDEAIELDGSSGTKFVEQSNDNGSINSEPALDEASPVNVEKGDVVQHCVESNDDKQENQETFPMAGTEVSDSTSVTSMEDVTEPKSAAPSEPEDISSHPPDLSNDKASTGNGNVFQNAKSLLTTSTKKMKVIPFV